MNELISLKEKKVTNESCSNLRDIKCVESNQLNMEQLLNLIVPDDELNNAILKTYNEVKDNYELFVYCCQSDQEYDVFINILCDGRLYSNILRKPFSDNKSASTYFDKLSNIIKENDLKTLQKILLDLLTY